MKYAVILVHSTSHALRLEKLLLEQALTCKMIPVPRQISSNCGVCIRVPQAQVEEANHVIAAAQVEIKGIHLL